MNFLAHAKLSFDDSPILIGNMISDFVKGKNKLNYPDSIQMGIQLHRMIDSYTDSHPIIQEAKEIFRPAYRLYSGAIIDVLFDHFLATDTAEFTEPSLQQFSLQVYMDLEKNQEWFPPHFATMFTYMKRQNWLYGYRLPIGAENSLKGLVNRAKYLENSEEAIRLFNLEYDTLKDYYRRFWPELKKYAETKLNDLRG